MFNAMVPQIRMVYGIGMLLFNTVTEHLDYSIGMLPVNTVTEQSPKFLT